MIPSLAIPTDLKNAVQNRDAGQTGHSRSDWRTQGQIDHKGDGPHATETPERPLLPGEQADRKDDVSLLATHFAGEESPGFTTDAMQALVEAPWPGNVRQLRNVVQGAVAVAGGTRIGVSHLALEAGDARGRPGPGSEPGSALPRGATLREIERQAILQALEDCDGNRTRAAKQLDIDRSTLRRKIQDYGIDE